MKYYRQGDECTFEPGQEEYELLEALADKLMELSPNGFKYWVDDVYLDYGSRWMWTTIISEDTISPYFQSTYQALSPAEWLALMNGEDITEIAEHVLSDKYCPDKIKSSKSIRKGTYVKSDVNSYSYIGDGFADDRITLAHYTDDNGYVELVKDLSTCYVTAQGFGYRNSYDYYCEYPMADIDEAIEDFNRCVQHFGGKRRLRRSTVEFELSKYGKSLDEYISSATNTCNIGAKPSYVSADSRYTYSQDDKVFTNGNMQSQVSIEHYGNGQERYTVTYWTVLENGEEYNAKTIMDTYYSPKYYYNLQSARRAAKKIIGLE